MSVHPREQYPLFDHQQKTLEFMQRVDRGFINSGLGSGKTRCILEWYSQRDESTRKRMLVLAPLSILQPAWGDDIDKWTPELSYSLAIAPATKRKKAFEQDTDVVITNHDAVKWVMKPENKHYLEQFDTLVIDEFTAFKQRTSQRSQAVAVLRLGFKYRYLLSGTPTPNSVTDIWHPAILVDDGERLGTSFFKFQSQVCNPVQVGPDPNMVQWVDRPGAAEMVADALRDITIRFATEDCVDLPAHRHRVVYTELPPKIMKQYAQLRETSVLAEENINGVHAGAKVKKLLQLCSGAVYDDEGEARVFHTDRYSLVMGLVEEAGQSVVAFNWRHEREALCELAEKLKITYGVIDGSVNQKDRARAVQQFQAGKIRVLFCHPASAGHGLTLTAGERSIWCTPTYNSEHFEQFNRRIYRTGQTKKTETIMISAKHTHEEQVYEKLQGKCERMSDLLDIFRRDTQNAG